MSWSTSPWVLGKGNNLFLQEPGAHKHHCNAMHCNHHHIYFVGGVQNCEYTNLGVWNFSLSFLWIFSTAMLCRLLDDDLPEWQEMNYMLRISQPPDTCRWSSLAFAFVFVFVVVFVFVFVFAGSSSCSSTVGLGYRPTTQRRSCKTRGGTSTTSLEAGKASDGKGWCARCSEEKSWDISRIIMTIDPRFNVVVTQRAKKEMAQAEKAQQATHLKKREYWKSSKSLNFLKIIHGS